MDRYQMIEIHGVTKKEMAMLDKIWSCGTEEEFLEWHDSLSYQDKLVVSKLLETLRIEMIDSETGNNFTMANEILSRYKK